jgi:hypothetical protein
MPTTPDVPIITAPSKTATEPDFFKAMMAFQYGTREESDAGFETMKQQCQPEKEGQREQTEM